MLNLSVDVSSIALVKLARERGALYLDTCIEPWAGGYFDANASVEKRSNYSMRLDALALRDGQERVRRQCSPTAPTRGWCRISSRGRSSTSPRDTGVETATPQNREQWGRLAQRLGIKVIHIAERDTQVSKSPKKLNEFVNTWSVDGFVSEGAQPAELGWGTHERHFPADGGQARAGIGLRDLSQSSRREHAGAHLDAEGRPVSRIS